MGALTATPLLGVAPNVAGILSLESESQVRLFSVRHQRELAYDFGEPS